MRSPLGIAAQMGEGAHPFYTNQPGQVPQQIPTGRSVSYDDGGQGQHVEQSQTLQELQQAQQAHQASQQLAHSEVETPEPTARKPRTKVLRACDECRRKNAADCWIAKADLPRLYLKDFLEST